MRINFLATKRQNNCENWHRLALHTHTEQSKSESESVCDWPLALSVGLPTCSRSLSPTIDSCMLSLLARSSDLISTAAAALLAARRSGTRATSTATVRSFSHRQLAAAAAALACSEAVGFHRVSRRRVVASLPNRRTRAAPLRTRRTRAPQIAAVPTTADKRQRALRTDL